MVGTFSGKKSLKALSNKVFRFIQQTLLILLLHNALPHLCLILQLSLNSLVSLL
ncbi:unknown protein [Microcystis aeruginosa NIES-843]|uniref:Uncharacterized protein n=1 Tax=Microcystis aeruginosa (strain NIES-843 / IAM M-2473) TaxID=449447 RepID=B0JI27_MICAN|nr:unknown protein [Microcystis aeruginosa NIES-843]